MPFIVKGKYTKDVEIRVSSNELLKAVERAWHKKHLRSLDIEVQEGWLMYWECTSAHNNDWEYVKGRRATEEEELQYFFWKKLKDLLQE